jgi:hypothetical protein
MRPFFLIAVTALALAACDKNGEADRGTNAGAGLTADKIVANDITAIDAVTGDAANMAADIDFADALADLSNNSGSSNSSATDRSRGQARPSRSGASSPKPASGPSESTAETTANSE